MKLASFLFLLFLFGCQTYHSSPPTTSFPSNPPQPDFLPPPQENTTLLSHNPSIELHDNRISVEIADTPEKRAYGLMNRLFLEDNQGMLFIFPDENYRGFWMKHTFIPLDMIFLNSTLTIVDLHTAFPCKENETCIAYESKEKAQYVLEINAGLAERYDYKIGDTFLISNYSPHLIG